MTTETFRPRVLVTKIGLDGHDRGSRIVAAACRDAGLGDVCVVVGGIVPDNEEALLREAGVREVFHPGSTMDQITGRIRAYAVEARRLRAAEENPR